MEMAGGWELVFMCSWLLRWGGGRGRRGWVHICKEGGRGWRGWVEGGKGGEAGPHMQGEGQKVEELGGGGAEGRGIVWVLT